jgi:hypothetical protein
MNFFRKENHKTQRKRKRARGLKSPRAAQFLSRLARPVTEIRMVDMDFR